MEGRDIGVSKYEILKKMVHMLHEFLIFQMVLMFFVIFEKIFNHSIFYNLGKKQTFFIKI